MPNLTSIADWAKSVGISRQSAYEAVERCGIPVTDKKVDAEYATFLYGKHTRPRANGTRPDPLATTAQPIAPAGARGVGGSEPKPHRPAGYDTSRAAREEAEAAMAQIKLAELAGKFLLKADVDAAVFEVARALRDGLTNCARRIAADVAPLVGADECEAVIEREHRALLESLAHAMGEKLDVQLEGAEA